MLCKIVPFGKFKGQLIEEVLDDPQFLSWSQWALNQPGIRDRWPAFCQVIINRGAEPEETPDHNALQVKFLDDDFCLRFCQQLLPNFITVTRDQFNLAQVRNLEILVKQFEYQKEFTPQGLENALARRLRHIDENELRFNPDQIEKHKASARAEHENALIKHREKLAELDRIRKLLSVPIAKISFRINRQFEVQGVDVELTIGTHIFWGSPPGESRYWDTDRWRDWRAEADWYKCCNVEIKPTIGDDYPAVLRQMKRTQSNVLLVGNYTGLGATEKQFVQTMATRISMLSSCETSNPSC